MTQPADITTRDASGGQPVRRGAGPGLATVEWPTLGLLGLCYGGWAWGMTGAVAVSLPLAMAVVTVMTALHSSLSHEALHGHPTRSRVINAALVFPALSLVVPYLRFRDTHLAHHRDSRLTDPYDDPESNYLDPAVWRRLARWQRAVLRANNRLAGRLVLGPALGTCAFVMSDWHAIRRGERRVLVGWVLHLPAVAGVMLWIDRFAAMPLWAWGVCVYGGLALLKLRTFLEHRAHTDATGRTVIIEDRGPLAWIFLNNNLHLVHHLHAAAPWYALPLLYRADPERYLRANHGYRYRSYAEVLARYLLHAKDPVAHPLWPDPGGVVDTTAPTTGTPSVLRRIGFASGKSDTVAR
ncbi:fatty acid desaturase [Cognatishimia sp. F0-27]|uniref:fatty acid desaturase n=1 Tax=Cognatishimia sp. F0-27 TaxID=2816855 RepID=UPI001D0CD194|nr:fatty acid desaturase [Cognatishimia sp. F0-27]MCC1492246.1 fatty acid desaturase [Cognatishimia sp. F0-27]